MSKLFIRIVAFLLVPCLTVGPSLAASFPYTPPMARRGFLPFEQGPFQDQALAPHAMATLNSKYSQVLVIGLTTAISSFGAMSQKTPSLWTLSAIPVGIKILTVAASAFLGGLWVWKGIVRWLQTPRAQGFLRRVAWRQLWKHRGGLLVNESGKYSSLPDEDFANNAWALLPLSPSNELPHLLEQGLSHNRLLYSRVANIHDHRELLQKEKTSQRLARIEMQFVTPLVQELQDRHSLALDAGTRWMLRWQIENWVQNGIRGNGNLLLMVFAEKPIVEGKTSLWFYVINDGPLMPIRDVLAGRFDPRNKGEALWRMIKGELPPEHTYTLDAHELSPSARAVLFFLTLLIAGIGKAGKDPILGIYTYYYRSSDVPSLAEYEFAANPAREPLRVVVDNTRKREILPIVPSPRWVIRSKGTQYVAQSGLLKRST